MFKQLIVLIGLSVTVVLFTSYAHETVQFLLSAHDWVVGLLANMFSEGQSGNLAKGLIALLSIPFIAGLVPAIIYWMARRHWLPFFMEIVWFVWLIQAGALVVAYKAAT